METLVSLLIFVHVVAFVAGGSNSVVMPIIGGKIAAASPETRNTLFAIGNSLAQIGKIAMGTLLVTGPLILWLKHGGLGGASPWFWVKMALIVVMLVAIVISGINFKKAQKGDTGAAAKAELAGRVTAIAFAGVLLSAVLAFA